MFDFFPSQFEEYMLSYDQFCLNYSGEKEDFILSQKLYNHLSELQKEWIWVLGVGIDNPETAHLAGLFYHTAVASERIRYLILEAEMEEKPVLFCYLKSTQELVGECFVPPDYQPSPQQDQDLFDNLCQCVKDWKEFTPTALN